MTAELEWLYTTCTSKEKNLLGAMISHSSKLRAWKSLNMRGWKNFQGKSKCKITNQNHASAKLHVQNNFEKKVILEI